MFLVAVEDGMVKKKMLTKCQPRRLDIGPPAEADLLTGSSCHSRQASQLPPFPPEANTSLNVGFCRRDAGGITTSALTLKYTVRAASWVCGTAVATAALCFKSVACLPIPAAVDPNLRQLERFMVFDGLPL